MRPNTAINPDLFVRAAIASRAFHIGRTNLFSHLARRAKNTQVGHCFPLRWVRLGRRGRRWRQGHKPSSVYPPEGGQMVISLGWLSPATSTRPTRSSNDPGRVSLPIWPCSDWGLPCHACCQTRGGLLPHRFTLTPTRGRFVFCGPIRRLAAPRRYLAVYPVELGLSSAHPTCRCTATIAPARHQEETYRPRHA